MSSALGFPKGGRPERPAGGARMTGISHETIEELFYQQIRALTLYGKVR